jgi:hypothetical protein
MSEFSGNFEFFCSPTKTADNKKLQIELTGNYDVEDFCEVQKFWDEKVTLSVIREEAKNVKGAIWQNVGVTVLAPKSNKGSKDTKTYTIKLVKPFDHDQDMELFKLLYQPVFIEWSKIQPTISFEDPEEPEDQEEP